MTDRATSLELVSNGMRSAELRRGPLRIVLCGRLEGGDAELAAASLSQLPSAAIVVRIVGPPETWAQHAAAADLCVVLQSWPEEIPVSVAHAVVAACSASRLIVCEGAWCASAGRTRSVWPRAVCVSVEDLRARIEFELAVLNGERTPLPATAALDEIFLMTYGSQPPGSSCTISRPRSECSPSPSSGLRSNSVR